MANFVGIWVMKSAINPSPVTPCANALVERLKATDYHQDEEDDDDDDDSED